jgi:hypothetical protein
MTADRWIRWLTAAVVLAVAAFAAVVSYSHIYDLGRVHGQSGTAARLLPLSVDGLILAAGLVLLAAARQRVRAPRLARWMLWLGISATVGANVSYGLPYGPLGAVVSAWPAVAFVGAAEMALGMVRSARHSAAAYDPADIGMPQPNAAVPADAESAARAALAASVAASNPISQRQLMTRFGLTRAQATRVRQAVAAGSNGHAPSDAYSSARPVAAGQRASVSPDATPR